MKGDNEINYQIYINTDKGSHWFWRESIWNNFDKHERSHERTKSDYVL